MREVALQLHQQLGDPFDIKIWIVEPGRRDACENRKDAAQRERAAGELCATLHLRSAREAESRRETMPVTSHTCNIYHFFSKNTRNVKRTIIIIDPIVRIDKTADRRGRGEVGVFVSFG